MAYSSRFWPIWKVIDRRMNRREMIIQSMPQIKNALPRLSTVNSCVMISCGNFDMEFVCWCLPNVRQLTVVEPDADQMAELKPRVSQLLPNVSSDFCQETAQNWKGADQPFDAVLLFHCLYHVPRLERPALFKKLFDNIVADGGYVFVLIAPYNSENPSVFDRLKFSLMNESMAIDGIQISDMMRSAGFCECYQLPITVKVDMEEPDDDLMALFMHWNEGRLSCEQVREAAKEVVGGEKIIPHESWLGVFRKP